MKLAKGEHPRDLYAACGGPTLGRVRSFVKGEETQIGPPNKQDYTKTGDEGEYAACKPNKKRPLP